MYRQSLDLFEQAGDKQGAADMLHSLGAVCGEQEDLDGAEGFYRKSLSAFEELGNQQGVADALINLGGI